jgi:hypothetical protein
VISLSTDCLSNGSHCSIANVAIVQINVNQWWFQLDD